MFPTLVESILRDRRIAYALTDAHLKVTEVSGAIDILIDSSTVSVGCSLLDLVPELVGSEEVLADILNGKLPRFQLEWVNRDTNDGQGIYLTMVNLPYRDGHGQIVGLIHLVQDVTGTGALQQRLAQHRNELRLLRDQLTLRNQELSAANAELQRLDELKSVFVSVAAHELRTPLSSILGCVEVLLDEDLGKLNHEQREYLQLVQHGSHRLLTITNDLLDVTRIEAGRLELVLQPTDLAAVVETVAAEFDAQISSREQRLTVQSRSGLPPALLDRTRGVQIIGNLLSNASKYTLDGGNITVAVSLAQDEGFLQVSVRDDGVGISSQDQGKLFERFFRAESALLTGAEGVGMGLYVARSLAELHGGRIWCESDLGKGSAFHVTFPIADELPTDESPEIATP
jgi:signal transduction histidine kinase